MGYINNDITLAVYCQILNYIHIDSMFRFVYTGEHAPHGYINRGRNKMSSYLKDKKEILVRLRRMEGQIKGIHKMVEEDKYCVDVLNQLSSVMAASQKVANIIMKDHIKGCVRDALTRDEHSDEYVDELVSVVDRFTKR